MTKRILSFLIVAMFLLSTVPTMAAIINGSTTVLGDGAGYYATMSYDGTLITVTTTLKGEANVTGAQYGIAYDQAKVALVNCSDKVTPIALNTDTTTVLSIYNSAVEVLYNPGSAFNPAYKVKVPNGLTGTGYVIAGYAYNDTVSQINLTAGQNVNTHKIYFLVRSGATVDANTVKMNTTMSAYTQVSLASTLYRAASYASNFGYTYVDNSATPTPAATPTPKPEIPAELAAADSNGTVYPFPTDSNGKTISWVSDAPLWMTNTGDYVCPPNNSEDKVITFTASIAGFGSTTRTVTIPKMAAPPTSLALDYTNVTFNMFNGMNDVAVDSSGNVWVADFNNSRLLKFDSAGVKQNEYKDVGVGAFNKPSAISIDAADNIYVADTYNDRIVMFKDNGAANAKVGFNRPLGVTGNNGKVYVADTRNNRVVVFDFAESYLNVIAPNGVGDGQVRAPQDVTVDNKGNIWVSDTGNKRVQMFRTVGNSGTFRMKYAADDYTFGVDADPATGNVYVAMRFLGKIMCVNNPNVGGYGNTYANGGKFLTPTGICVRNGHIYVADPTMSRLVSAPLAPIG